jgi:hypothetical protein
VASWLDEAGTPDRRADLVRRLTGLLTAAGPLLAAGGAALEPLLARVAELPDADFLERLPALRGGFDTLSPAARDRLLAVVEERLDTRIDADTTVPPEALAAWAAADFAARGVLAERGLLAGLSTTDEPESHTNPSPCGQPTSPAEPPLLNPRAGGPQNRYDHHTLTAQTRWRLVLGRQAPDTDPTTARMAGALDELYGTGRGEGSRSDLGAGQEAGYPSVREWAEDLAALFGPAVREEVLGAAVAAGRKDAITALDPASARPSVELLQAVLEHAGGLPESRIAALRPLVERIVAELTRELSTRLRPALSGVTVPRPSHRPGGGLDLARTLRANLATARRGPDGAVTVVPERPVFRTKARRTADWRLILVVDVSGSMEASTIWSALTASILAGVPALTTHFVAFDTEVMDFTDRVHDPLGLLLGVKVGGGTHIAAGLRYARELVTVPSRTLVAVVSDFEEGWPLGGLLGEVRTLVGSGAHLLGCASLDDRGKPRYSTAVAAQLVTAGMPVAALSPTELARWVGEKVR